MIGSGKRSRSAHAAHACGATPCMRTRHAVGSLALDGLLGWQLARRLEHRRLGSGRRRGGRLERGLRRWRGRCLGGAQAGVALVRRQRLVRATIRASARASARHAGGTCASLAAARTFAVRSSCDMSVCVTGRPRVRFDNLSQDGLARTRARARVWCDLTCAGDWQAGRQALPRVYSYVHARVTYTGASGAIHWATHYRHTHK